MVKIFVGNIQAESNPQNEAELRQLFEAFGEVKECVILTGKSFGFVHMKREEDADKAIKGLDGANIFGSNITVERSSNQVRPTKIFVGNIQAESNKKNEAELRALFLKYGEVVECAILTGKNYAFVHMAQEDEADQAIQAINGTYLFGNQINVEKSANQNRTGNRGRGRGRGFDRGFGRGHDRGYDRSYESFGRNRYQPYESGRYHSSALDDPLARYSLSLPRDPYGRDAFLRGLYARELYAREAALLDRYGKDDYVPRSSHRRYGDDSRSRSHGRDSRGGYGYHKDEYSDYESGKY